METHTYRATIVLKDEQGNSISEMNYVLPVESFDIDVVEASVTELRKKALPQIENAILTNEQSIYCKKKGRTDEKR